MDEAKTETLKFLLRNNAALMRQYLAALDKLESRIELLEVEFMCLRKEVLEHACRA
jgi:Mn-containing catalase